MRTYTLCALVFAVLKSFTLTAQTFEEYYARKDSVYFLENYPYILPILGDKVHDRKIMMPLPFGIMFNALVVRQELDINRLNVGFGNRLNNTNPNMIDLTQVVKFNKIVAQTSTFNFRLDAWPLPFWNVYGILGQTRKADINIPITEPFPFTVNTEVAGWYAGYGTMLNYKVGPVFMSLDGNQSYNHNPRVDKPVIYSLLSFRAGPIFNIRKFYHMKLMLWAGVMYSHFNGSTVGSINTEALAPNAPNYVDQLRNDVNNWYDGLGNIKQALYKGIYNKLDSGLESLKNGVQNSFIAYDLNKTSSRPWNMLVGTQWQINDHWQVRVEAQFLGARTAGLFSFNYRFGIKGKTLFSGSQY